MVAAVGLVEQLAKKKAKTPGKWLTGDKLTWVDFQAYEYLDQAQKLVPDLLEPFSYLSQHLANVEELPGLRQYFDSDRYQAYPLWSARAFLGHSAVDE